MSRWVGDWVRGGDGGDGIPLLFSVKWSIIAVSIDVI